MTMHLRIIFAVSISLGWGFMQCGYAQEYQDFLRDLDEIRDPFQSQLPPPKDVPAVQHVPQNINPPVNGTSSESVFRSAPMPTKVVPQPAKQQDVKAMVVKGLVWNTDEPQAIVNDKVVRVGDSIDGMKIISIQKKGVEFHNNGLKVFVDVSGNKNVAGNKL
jgi:hypothetical protein